MVLSKLGKLGSARLTGKSLAKTRRVSEEGFKVTSSCLRNNCTYTATSATHSCRGLNSHSYSSNAKNNQLYTALAVKA